MDARARYPGRGRRGVSLQHLEPRPFGVFKKASLQTHGGLLRRPLGTDLNLQPLSPPRRRGGTESANLLTTWLDPLATSPHP